MYRHKLDSVYTLQFFKQLQYLMSFNLCLFQRCLLSWRRLRQTRQSHRQQPSYQVRGTLFGLFELDVVYLNPLFLDMV